MEQTTNENTAPVEKRIFPPDTMAFTLAEPMTVRAGSRTIRVTTEKNGPAEEGFASASVGDVLLISPVEGNYAHCGADGTLIVDGLIHGVMRDV